MNRDYEITCCSTVDLSRALLEEKKIPFVPFSFLFGQKVYDDDYGLSYPIDKFYADMNEGATPTTSQPNADRYKEMFESCLTKGKDVLHITLSSGISGAVNSALIAAEELNEKYDNKVYVLDSLCCSGGYGMLVLSAWDNREKGLSLEENLSWLQENRLNLHHWFFSSNLSAYVRGGRVSSVAGFIGGALKICPLMCVSLEGKLEPMEMIRTQGRASKAIVDKMEQYCQGGKDYDGYCIISHSDCQDVAENIKASILDRFPSLKEVKIFPVGAVIGAHTGPRTIALYFYGSKRIK